MGMNNRQRRAAKARAKARQRNTRQHATDQPPDFSASDQFRIGAVKLALRHLVLGYAGGATLDRADFYEAPDAHQQLAVDDQLADFVRNAVRHGWTPLDLYEAARRKHDPAVVGHLMSIVADETGRHAPGTVHPVWAQQLATLARTRFDGCADWADAVGLPWSSARAELIGLLIMLHSLPVVEEVLPAPGAAATSGAAESGVDERVLRKVRALLAKAESTSFSEEAEALTAKAQKLMTAHAIERTLAADKEATPRAPVVRRMWLDAPYTSAKSMLVAAVARSNHCYSILSSDLGLVTLVGFEPDLDTVELLSTSLLVQATRAMTASGSHIGRYGESRTRSFRQSFLVAYAGRIGERLRESAAGTESAADSESGGALLPVLAARDTAVDDAVTAMFPQVKHKRIGVSNATGWGAGRAAADLARFDIYSAVTGAEKAG